MRRFAIFLLAIAAVATAGQASAQPAVFAIDPTHSVVSFAIRHLMLSNVRGEFTKYSGTVTVAGDDAATAAIEATIDVDSVNTREPKRDGHLKSPDFFDVAKYPTMTFRSKKVTPAGPGKFSVLGELTIHGVTKEVTLAVDGVTGEMKDPWGGTRVGAHATTTINRKDFGLTYNKVLETGGVMVGEEVAITLDLELAKRAPAAAAASAAKK